MPAVLIIAILTIAAFYFGRVIRRIRLPAIIGFMLVGVMLGPSGFHIIDENFETDLSFLSEIALSFVALSIGLELNIAWLKKQGMALVYAILGEVIGATVLVTAAVYALITFVVHPAALEGRSEYLALALLFGALAAATAPAGTVAVIREFKAKGNLTRTLYAVVGYDDALAIIVFGFASTFAKSILMLETGAAVSGMLRSILSPIGHIALSLAVGAGSGAVFCILARRVKHASEVLILLVGFVLAIDGLSTVLHMSFILTSIVFGALVLNTQPQDLIQKTRDSLGTIMPLLFIFLFGLAGANLNIAMLPKLGLLGLTYVIARSIGKMAGARIGSWRMEEKIKKYLGLGLLSQAGVAIGLAIITKQQLSGLGRVIETVNGRDVTSGDIIGSVVMTTITATCVFFEIIGPIFAKLALTRAGEIQEDKET